MSRFNPSEPNTTREIKFTYVTDENGTMSISVDTAGFEGGEDYVALFLNNTLELLAQIKTPNNTDK